VEYEELAGSTRNDKAVSLIEYLQRNGRLTDLVTQCRQLRPRTTWPDMASIETNSNLPGTNQLITAIQDWALPVLMDSKL
jgi:hypothetical protein